MKLDHYLIPYIKINSKWIKDLNVGSDTPKLLKKTYYDIGLGNDLLDMTPKAQAIEQKIGQWDYIKLKGF